MRSIIKGSRGIDSPVVIAPPRNANWKNWGGKFSKLTPEVKRIFEDIENRARNND